MKIGPSQSVSFSLSSASWGPDGQKKTGYYGLIDVTPTLISGYTCIGIASLCCSHLPNAISGHIRKSNGDYQIWILNDYGGTTITDSFAIRFLYARTELVE